MVATYTAAGDAHGWPVATLTDNGAVHTSLFTGGRNGFDTARLPRRPREERGARPSPTQGKIERFHQTLKRWLGRPAGSDRPRRAPAQLDAFGIDYNEQRPQGRSGVTPQAYRASPKAHARRDPNCGATAGSATTAPTATGAITKRGPAGCTTSKSVRAFARQRVLAIVDEHEVTVVALDTGEILSTHLIEPDRTVLAQPTTRPRPMAGVSSDRLITCVADVATHVSPMS